MPISILSIPVMGADHPNKRGPGRRFEIALCAPGESVDLVPEPKNPVDPRAIAIFSMRGVQLGYVPGDKCQWFTSMLANGRELCAIFQGATRHGALVRVGLDGTIPTLPDRAPFGPPIDDGFPADPIWPDD